MTDLVTRLLSLWSDGLPADDESAVRAFRELYTDPVPVNGTLLSAADLIARARTLHAALTGLRHELLEQVRTPEHLAIGFRLHGRHVGPLPTALGPVPATGQEVSLRVTDILTITNDRISSVWMVADELSALIALGVLTTTGTLAPAT
ncbi:ester cyclase [Frankia sp. R82]|uniref:ester cyclase n=1 Tax=Frankia sp. R82 TaxID=2950553 RepID=UPI002043F932|nr:ester cyclase [Frankia sp. R82]MCM3883501.1 ester cyclase [Frankia sp. R82]